MTTEDKRNVERVEFFMGANREWYFHRVAANNKVVSNSEGYQHKADAFEEAAKLYGADEGLAWFEERATDNGSEWIPISAPTAKD